MRKFQFVSRAVMALVLVQVSLPASFSAPAMAVNRPAIRKDHHPMARKIIEKTRRILRRASEAAAKGHKEKDKLRNAFAHQQAARLALRKDKPAIAAHLSLEARHMARLVIQANGGKVDKDDAQDDAAETAASKSAVEADAHAFVSEAEGGLPDADGCIKSPEACDKD